MPKKKTLEAGTTLFARIEEKQHEAIRLLAFKDRCSIAQITRNALDMYIKSRKDQPGRKPSTKAKRAAVSG